MAKKPRHEQLEQRVQGLEEQVSALTASNESQRKQLEEKVKFEKGLRDRIWRELAQELEFEKLLSEVSMMFARIPAKEVEREIKGVIRRVAEMFALDRGSFAQYSNDLDQIYATDSWAREGLLGYFSLTDDDIFITKEHFPWLTEKISREEIVAFSNVEDLPREAEKDKHTFQELGVKSGISIPYFVEGSFLFAITFASVNSGRDWSEAMIHRFRRLGEIFSNAVLRKKADQEMQKAFSEIQDLKDRLQQENVLLRKKIKTIAKRPEITGESDAIKRVLSKVEQVAKTNTTVLILGNTGTGKELVARAIHDLSSRRNHPMVTVNCAALPGTLVESELFGREKGAYTGAMSKQVGRFEIADGSTIFLDEIGELPMELQVKLLRVLEQGRFERLGSSTTLSVDVRVVAATNRDLEKAIEEGRFRQDLFYRLNVFPIRIPSLKERPEDILPLTRVFIKEFSEAMGKRIDSIEKTGLEALRRYHWPGNIRELRNLIERAMIASPGHTLVLELPQTTQMEASRNHSLAELERAHILSVLEKTSWRIKGKNRAAEILGLNPGTLYSKMKRLGLKPPRSLG